MNFRVGLDGDNLAILYDQIPVAAHTGQVTDSMSMELFKEDISAALLEKV